MALPSARAHFAGVGQFTSASQTPLPLQHPLSHESDAAQEQPMGLPVRPAHALVHTDSALHSPSSAPGAAEKSQQPESHDPTVWQGQSRGRLRTALHGSSHAFFSAAHVPSRQHPERQSCEEAQSQEKGRSVGDPHSWVQMVADAQNLERGGEAERGAERGAAIHMRNIGISNNNSRVQGGRSVSLPGVLPTQHPDTHIQKTPGQISRLAPLPPASTHPSSAPGVAR